MRILRNQPFLNSLFVRLGCWFRSVANNSNSFLGLVLYHDDINHCYHVTIVYVRNRKSVKNGS